MRIQLPESARPSTQTTVWNLCFDHVFNDYDYDVRDLCLSGPEWPQLGKAHEEDAHRIFDCSACGGNLVAASNYSGCFGAGLRSRSPPNSRWTNWFYRGFSFISARG